MIRLRDILNWWTRRHTRLSRIPEWKAAYRAERRALAVGCTQEVGRARKAMRAAVLENLRGVSHG
jgi:hypothetical protein